MIRLTLKPNDKTYTNFGTLTDIDGTFYEAVEI